MGETTKIAILFWCSGAVLLTGVLLLNFSLPVAAIIVGAMGLVSSLAWFIQHLREMS